MSNNQHLQELNTLLEKKSAEIKKQKIAFETIQDNHFVQCNEKIVSMLCYGSKEELLQLETYDLQTQDGRNTCNTYFVDELENIDTFRRTTQ